MIQPLLADDVLLADIEAAPHDRLVFWWLGQSGFLVQHASRRILFDPYLSDSLTKKYANTDKPHLRMSRRVIDPARLTGINFVTSTHAHTDHLDAETLAPLLNANPQATLVYPAANESVVRQRTPESHTRFCPIDHGQTLTIDTLTLTAAAVPHPTFETDPHGRHKYLAYLLTLSGRTILHTGDGLYGQHLQHLPRAVHLAFVPINGKVGNMSGAEAAKLARSLDVALAIPCHYDMFLFNTADPAEAFIPTCRQLGQKYLVPRLGQRVVVDAAV